MAQELENVELPLKPRNATIRYPWNEWMNGSTWEVKRGEDFTTSVQSFVTGLYIRAKTCDVKVTSKRDGDKVTFQFHQVEA